MAANSTGKWYHSNRYHAQSACKYCGGIIRHLPTCIEVNDRMRYAYEIITDPARLTMRDELILHSLGVVWTAQGSPGKATKKNAEPKL
jgi:hypothetical protein